MTGLHRTALTTPQKINCPVVYSHAKENMAQ